MEKRIYAKLSGAGGCIGVAADTLKVNTTPVGTNTSQTLCSTDPGGTTAVFNLTLKDATVTGGATGVTVLGWYTTSSFTTVITDSTARTASNGTVVYAKLSGAGGCIGVAAYTLKVNTTLLS